MKARGIPITITLIPAKRVGKFQRVSWADFVRVVLSLFRHRGVLFPFVDVMDSREDWHRFIKVQVLSLYRYLIIRGYRAVERVRCPEQEESLQRIYCRQCPLYEMSCGQKKGMQRIQRHERR